MSAQHPSGGPAAGEPFTAQLRARPQTIVVGADDADVRWTVRVQSAEVWDTVRVSAPPAEPIGAIKARALAELSPGPGGPEAYVLKLGGFEVLDESASLSATGARDGSIFLLAHRRRRPVR
jgi:hypothetical protein